MRYKISGSSSSKLAANVKSLQSSRYAFRSIGNLCHQFLWDSIIKGGLGKGKQTACTDP